MGRYGLSERLDQWLAEVQAHAVAELRAFAQGLMKDYEAVKTGLTLPWSNGPTEGHIHKLKTHQACDVQARELCFAPTTGALPSVKDRGRCRRHP